MQVRMITAPWCKRCAEMKPDVIHLSRLASAKLLFENYDDMPTEETDNIKSLPSFQVRKGSEEWNICRFFSVSEYEQFKNILLENIHIEEMDF